VKPLIGVVKPAKGGFGNRLLGYLALRAISRRFEVGYFSLNHVDKKLVRGIYQRPLVPLRFTTTQIVESVNTNPASLEEQLLFNLQHGSTSVIRGPMLGETYAFFSDTEIDRPGLITFGICSEYQQISLGHHTAVLHFRSGDFEQWNSRAIHSENYYHRAIDFISSSASITQMRICADNYESVSVKKISARLAQDGLLAKSHECRDPFTCDFAAMAGAVVLVASASTYSITAGLVGGPKVIHSAEWVENRVRSGETFWRMVSDNVLPNYSVEAIL